jgi:hypothetical protein
MGREIESRQGIGWLLWKIQDKTRYALLSFEQDPLRSEAHLPEMITKLIKRNSKKTIRASNELIGQS